MKSKIKKLSKIIKCALLYIYYFLYCKLKKINNSDVWLLSERGTDARDNAYHLYKYLKNNHKEIKIKYVIDKNSVDSKKINDEDIINYGSKEHFILFITAGKLISTHIMGFSPDMSLFWRLNKINLLKVHGKKIMLQHGITQNYIEILNAKNSKLDLFICGAYQEYKFILEKFGYTKDIAKYTGFARYDNLKNRKPKNQILIMPTFRKWLNYTDDFTESDYYKKWNEVINNKKIIKYIEDNNMELVFYPHYEAQKYINNFNSSSSNVIIADFEHYDVQQLLIESKLLITDYSSVFFDFAYMNKRIIYYQFDINEFRKNHYKEGYFDYYTMGFGPVCTSLDQVIDNLISEKKDYSDRVKSFFKYNDSNNCKRIYTEINKLK